MPFLDPRRTAQARALPLLALPRADRVLGWAFARLTAEEMANQVLAACFGDTRRVSAQRFRCCLRQVRECDP